MNDTVRLKVTIILEIETPAIEYGDKNPILVESAAISGLGIGRYVEMVGHNPDNAVTTKSVNIERLS